MKIEVEKIYYSPCGEVIKIKKFKKRKMINYNIILNKLFKMELIKILPRESTKFAMDYFNGKEINVIEIGILEGEHTQSILENLNVKKITLIDPYEKYENYREDGNYENMETAEDIAKKRLNKFEDKIIWIKKYSSDAIKDLKEKVDFIYIDGNHKYDYVIEDLENYWNLLNKGGIISGHDIQSSEVSKAVIEFCNKKDLILNIGERRDWWISPKSSKEKK